MIQYQKEKGFIYLGNGSISYVLYINESGCLELLYFGKAIQLSDDDIACMRGYGDWASTYYDCADGKEKIFSDGYRAGVSRMELNSHGLWDKRFAPVVVKWQDGSFETDFRFSEFSSYEGIRPLPAPLPCAHGEKCETAEILLRDARSSLYARLFLTIFSDKDILVKSLVIENGTEETVTLLRAMSMQLDLPGMAYDLVHFRGRWGSERRYEANALHDGAQEVSSNLGRSSHEENPFVYLKSANATADSGEAIGFNLIYSGNFKFRVECGPFRSAHLSYGIDDEDFEWKLAPGERFVTPQAVISYSAAGTDRMSQNFHRFIRENLIRYRGEREYKPILFNSWEGCYFDFDTERLISYIDDACKIGTELFVLDDGWFGERNSDDRGLGDWFVNRDKVDLHRILAHCKQKGIRFGIWFEPEMVNYDSELYRAHPEYVLGRADVKERSLSRHQFHLDFSNPEVVENIYAQMKAFLEEYPVDYIKWDYNRTVLEHVSRTHGAERQGEIYHRLVLGYYSLLSRIAEEYPSVMIEGCASGGGRFDLGTLCYCPQIWASDESDPAQRIFINYNTSIGYPLSTIGAHVNDHKITSYRTKAMLALFGTYGYEMNPNMLAETEREELNEIAAVYRKYHKRVIEEGTLYHLLSPSEGNFMCMQAVSEDRTLSLVLLINKLKEADESRFLRLKGLDEKALYRNDWDGKMHSGAYYMTVGLNFTCVIFEEFSCRLIRLEKI